jgi:hypothetical protein
MSNNHKHPEPDTSLGKVVFEVDLDTGQFNIQVEKSTTGQLTNAQELFGLLPMLGFKLYAEELKRRSKRVVVV